jgi:ABC transporter substrate binding protein
MCGRARLSSDVSEIELVFSIPPRRPTPNITPSWKVVPTDPLLVGWVSRIKPDERATIIGRRPSQRMRRRELMLLLTGAMTAARALRAQQKGMPVVGYLNSFSSPQNLDDLSRGPIHQGLSETGYVEGQNMASEYRWAEGHYNRLPELAADLVSRKVDLIVTIGGTPPALAAKNATSTIPIVFAGVGDPVGRSRRQPRPAGRQPDGLQQHHHRADGQAARAAVGAGSPGRGDRPAREPKQSDYPSR